MKTFPPQCPSAELAEGHCPLPAPAGVSDRPVHFRWPARQAGGNPCRSGQSHRAPFPDVVSPLPVVAAAPSMHTRQLAAVGSTPHSRDTGQPVTVPSVPQCSAETPCAAAPIGVRSMRAAPVGNCPQWPITGRSLAGRWSGRGSIRTGPSMAVVCASRATTDTPPVTPSPVEVPGRPARAGRRRAAWPQPTPLGRARRRPQGATPPPGAEGRSSARPVSVPTHFQHPPCTSAGRR